VDDELFLLELRVAQCADKLVSGSKMGRGRDLRFGRSEREVLGSRRRKAQRADAERKAAFCFGEIATTGFGR